MNVYLGDIPEDTDYDIYVYDDDDSDDLVEYSTNAGEADELILTFPVSESKTYYIKVESSDGTYDSSNYYHLRVKLYTDINNWDSAETNNTFEDAKPINALDSTRYANIHSSTDKDFTD